MVAAVCAVVGRVVLRLVLRLLRRRRVRVLGMRSFVDCPRPCDPACVLGLFDDYFQSWSMSPYVLHLAPQLVSG